MAPASCRRHDRAHDAPGLREQAARRGAAAYLAKPLLGAALPAVVR
jgi:hypothetical protein